MDFISENSFPFEFPKFIPSVTGGFNLDKAVSVYLPLVSDVALVSYPNATLNFSHLPEVSYLFIDSGSYGFIKYGGKIISSSDSDYYELILNFKNKNFRVNPFELLEFQEKNAFLGFTLDIPYIKNGEYSALQYLNMSVKNAFAALENKNSDLKLAASVSFSDNLDDLKDAIKDLVTAEFDMIALGGLVPFFKDFDFMRSILDTVKNVCNKPIHIFGAGNPSLVKFLFKNGVSSTDSSSYARYALEGKLFNSKKTLRSPSFLEQMNLALLNLAYLTSRPLPLNLTTPLLKNIFPSSE